MLDAGWEKFIPPHTYFRVSFGRVCKSMDVKRKQVRPTSGDGTSSGPDKTSVGVRKDAGRKAGCGPTKGMEGSGACAAGAKAGDSKVNKEKQAGHGSGAKDGKGQVRGLQLPTTEESKKRHAVHNSQLLRARTLAGEDLKLAGKAPSVSYAPLPASVVAETASNPGAKILQSKTEVLGKSSNVSSEASKISIRAAYAKYLEAKARAALQVEEQDGDPEEQDYDSGEETEILHDEDAASNDQIFSEEERRQLARLANPEVSAHHHIPCVPTSNDELRESMLAVLLGRTRVHNQRGAEAELDALRERNNERRAALSRVQPSGGSVGSDEPTDNGSEQHAGAVDGSGMEP